LDTTNRKLAGEWRIDIRRVSPFVLFASCIFRMRCSGHVIGIGEMRILHTILVG